MHQGMCLRIWKDRQKYSLVLILPLKIHKSLRFPSPSTAAGHSVKAFPHFPQTYSIFPLTLNVKGLTTVQG